MKVKVINILHLLPPVRSSYIPWSSLLTAVIGNQAHYRCVRPRLPKEEYTQEQTYLNTVLLFKQSQFQNHVLALFINQSGSAKQILAYIHKKLYRESISLNYNFFSINIAVKTFRGFKGKEKCSVSNNPQQLIIALVRPMKDCFLLGIIG